MYNKEIKIVFGNKKIHFNYSYNDHTKFSDLFEYVSLLYPNFNLCQCFCFGNKFYYINNDMKLIDTNDLNEELQIKNINYDSKCHCSPKIKEYLKMSKMEIILKILNNDINVDKSSILLNRNDESKKDGDNARFSAKKIEQLINNNLNNNKEIENLIKILNNDLKEQKIINQDFKNEINNCKIQTKKLEEEENNLLSQLEQHKDIINDFNEKIVDSKNKINNYKIQIKKLEKEEFNLLNQLKQLKEIIKNFNEKIEDYKNRISKQNKQIKKLDKDKENLERNLEGNNKILIGKNNSISLKNLRYFNKRDFEDYYDVIIDIKSIIDINKGWEIIMNERSLKNYEEYKSSQLIKIGVIGNSNKGKTFILSKISNLDFPSDPNIRTKGLSVKYPEMNSFKDRKIAFLDSAPLDTPVLNTEYTERYAEKEIFKEKLRERLITELFLQNYIINTSDILIVVVGILTYSEQKLLNRIKTEIQRAKLKKTLYVIHNLITYTSINQVQEYIEEYLLKDASFHLEKGYKVSTSNKIEHMGDYYYEKYSDPHVFHLIYTNEGSEAGNYYNNYTLKIIENSYLNVIDLKNFDIIESIKERFIEVSKDIIENCYDLGLKDFCINDKDNYKYIKLKDEKEITLKKCLIEELGFSNLKENGFEPTYNFYKPKNENKIIIRVEVPGNAEIKCRIKYTGSNTIIQIIGKKKIDKEPERLGDNIYNSREFGDFIIDIPLKTEEYKILNEEPNKRFVNGLFIIECRLEEEKSESKESDIFNLKLLSID